MKQKCFFTYCWDNPTVSKDLMTYLQKEVQKQSDGKIHITMDKEEFHVSENFKENEKKILQSDSVVIFFTPDYKNIIDEKQEERGVFREYKYILEAWKKNEIAVIPIIVEGKIEKAITKDFRDYIAANFSKSMPIIEGKRGKKLNPDYKNEMTNLISTIIYETSVAHRRKDYCFSDTEEAYTVLFCNTDSKNKLPRGCMYKSDAYKNIMSKEGTSFLVGRKGSGKTTFFEVLEKYDPSVFDKRFKVLRPISVEDIREENIYSVIEKVAADYKVFGKGRIIELFWEIYLNLCAIYIVCVEEENHRIRDHRRSIFHTISNKLRRSFGVCKLDSVDVKRAIFTLSVELWENFITKEILNFATEEAFLASIDANFNVNNVIMLYFGKNDFNKLLRAIDQCEKNILVALDRFDTISDDFRREIKDDLQSENEKIKEDARRRAEFDKLLYRSLILTVEKLKLIDVEIMGNVDFCIILPRDRIDQIKAVDRDFAKKTFGSLSWDAIELLNVILLRLKVLYGFEFDESENIVEKFKEVMKKYMPTIPSQIKIEVSGQDKEIDLFQYLLRISFWRPRDIIKYFAVLYDANEKNMHKHKEIDMITLKNHLNTVTEDIIINGFYSEYDKVFYNIIDLMRTFEGSNVILSVSDFIGKIIEFRFDGIVFAEDNQLLGKMNLLYELGIFGLKFETKYINENRIGNELCFVFNEGMFPFEKAHEELIKGTKNIKIVLNPIFAKKLSLKYNTTEILGAYGWDYLMSNHTRKMGINRI